MGVDGPRGRAAGGRRRLSALGRAWLRLLGVAAEPVSFAVVGTPEAVRARLLASSTAGLAVRPWLDGVRVELPGTSPLLRDRPRALLRVLPDGTGTRVAGTVGVPVWPAIYAYFLPFMVLIVVTATSEAVRAPGPGRVFTAATNAFVGASMAWTVLANRRALPGLRADLTELVTGAR